MCFDRGSLRKKLDSFLIFFQVNFLQINLMHAHIGVILVLCFMQRPITYGRQVHAFGHHRGRIIQINDTPVH